VVDTERNRWSSCVSRGHVMLDTEEFSASDRGSETVGFVRCKDLIVPSLREAKVLAAALIQDHGFEFDPYFVSLLESGG